MEWTRDPREFESAVSDSVRVFPIVPPALVFAVIGAESRFDPRARRGEPHIGDASHGLMQLLERTARSLGYHGTTESLYIPAINIYYGAKLLSENLTRTSGRIEEAVSAYNGGFRPELGFGSRATKPVTVCLERNADGSCKRTRNVQPGEFGNQAYVDRVMKLYESFLESPPGTGGSTFPPLDGGARDDDSGSGSPGPDVSPSSEVVMKFKLGWKTITGALAWAAGAILGPDVVGGVTEAASTLIQAVGGLLAAVGLRHAVSKGKDD